MAEVQSITSIKDPHVLEARALTSAAGRRQAQKALLEGEESLTWALEAGSPLEYVLFHDRIGQHPLLDLLHDRGVECFSASEGILKKATETHYLIPFVGVAPLPQEAAAVGDFVLVLNGVQDYGNIGTIVRTACGFGIRDIVATGGDFDLFYRKTIEASRGKVFDVRLKRFASGCAAVDYLKGQGFQVVATSPYGRVLQASAHLEKKPLALIVGNETEGVSEELLQKADLVVQIPMSGQVESLNVGVATGISVYELKFKLVVAMLTRYIRTTLGREVNVAGKLIQWALDAGLREVCDLNSTQVILLMVLKCDVTMTLEQVGKDTATFGEALRALLQPLLERGYVYAQDDTITLTDAGEHLLGQLWGVVEASEDRILEGFSVAERQQLMDYLRRIQANCERMIEA